MSSHEVPCPRCGRRVEWNDKFPWRPFCSERCRMVDLGAWFSEERAIPDRGPPSPEAPGEPEES